MQETVFRAMGSHIRALLDSDTDEARELLQEVPGWFRAWEQTLSRFLMDSELTRLNQRAGQTVRVSPVLLEVVALAIDVAQATDGLVTPTVLGALELAGYDRDFALLESIGGTDSANGQFIPAPVPGWVEIVLDARHSTIRLPPGVSLDLGGSAKGWAAHQAALRLAAVAPALVDAGGDLAISGPRADGSTWPVAVAAPWDEADDLALLLLAAGGVATSGRDYRRWRRGGHMYHHLIDPRTGLPSQSDVVAATIVAPNCSAAEAAAKAVCLLGSRDGLAWIEQRPWLAGLLVCSNTRVLRSRGFEAYCWN